jgi:hypothetical protein
MKDLMSIQAGVSPRPVRGISTGPHFGADPMQASRERYQRRKAASQKRYQGRRAESRRQAKAHREELGGLTVQDLATLFPGPERARRLELEELGGLTVQDLATLFPLRPIPAPKGTRRKPVAKVTRTVVTLPLLRPPAEHHGFLDAEIEQKFCELSDVYNLQVWKWLTDLT